MAISYQTGFLGLKNVSKYEQIMNKCFDIFVIKGGQKVGKRWPKVGKKCQKMSELLPFCNFCNRFVTFFVIKMTKMATFCPPLPTFGHLLATSQKPAKPHQERIYGLFGHVATFFLIYFYKKNNIYRKKNKKKGGHPATDCHFVSCS